VRVTLRQLEYFAALADTGHFGRAAKRVAISQPALSNQIRELEAIVGVPLVERHARGATLTRAGVELAGRATRILADGRAIEQLSERYRDHLTGRLRLGIIPSIAPFLIEPLHARLAEGFAEVALVVRETITERLLRELEGGALDAILASAPLKADALVGVSLGRDRFLLARPPGAPPRRRGVADERLVLLEEGHCLRDQAIRHCALATPPVEEGVTSLATLVEMVATGACSTLLPELFARMKPAEAARVALTPFAKPDPARTIVLAWRRTDPRGAQFEALASAMRGWFGFDPDGREGLLTSLDTLTGGSSRDAR